MSEKIMKQLRIAVGLAPNQVYVLANLVDRVDPQTRCQIILK
jgi:hypothetical protein